MAAELQADFIPPDPTEPVPGPPDQGSSDAGQPGELSPNQDPTPDFAQELAETELMLAVAAVVDGVPTAQRVLAFAASLIRTNWGPPENINRFTRWFYGNSTKAAWCFIFISYVLAMASGTEALGLALIGGKKAFVPWIRKIKGYRDGASGLKMGAIVALFDFEHIEFFEKDLGDGWIQTIGGNVEIRDKSGRVISTDGVARKKRHRSDVAGHVNLAYAPAAPPDKPPASMPIPSPKLVVDGNLGSKTVHALQKALAFHLQKGLYYTGFMDTSTRKALQAVLKVKVDGDIGPVTIRALQKRVGVTQDGDWGNRTTKALQTKLNGGKF